MTNGYEIDEEPQRIPAPITPPNTHPETSRYREFTYYTTADINDAFDPANAPHWSAALDASTGTIIFGMELEDGKFVWSTDAPLHAALLEALDEDGQNEEEWSSGDDYAVRLQSSWQVNDDLERYEAIQLNASDKHLDAVHQMAQLLSQYAKDNVRLSISVSRDVGDEVKYETHEFTIGEYKQLGQTT